MRSVLGIIIVTLLSMQGTANGQFHEEPISTNVPHETIPLDSLIHYPEAALHDRIEGKVELQATVERDGSVSEVTIEHSSDPIFNAEAIRVVIVSHFEYPLSEESPRVSFLIGRTITFDLNNKRSLITTSRYSTECRFLVVDRWTKARGLICEDSEFQNHAMFNPVDFYPHETVPLDSSIHYPEEAVKNRIEGSVDVAAVIRSDGSVSGVKIERSSNPVFNTEAIRVMITTKFEHDPKNKSALVSMLIGRTITFDLNNKRSILTLSHVEDEYSMLVLDGWSKKKGLIYDDSKVRYISDANPSDFESHEIIPLDSLIRYPKKARKKRIEGDVIVQALVDKDDGSVSKVEIFKSDDSLLNEEAIRVIKAAIFSPSSGNGWELRTLHFRLKANPNAYKTASPIKYEDGYSQFAAGGGEPNELIPLEKLIHYPEVARKNGIEGKVTLQMLINKDGSVGKVELLKTTDSVFNEEAIRAMKSAHFTPAMQNGTPLKIWITRTINFRLKDIPKPQE